MIVRSLADIKGSGREVHAGTWTSRRLLLARDGMGFSLHETVIHPGTSTRMWYRNHLEAVYCIAGSGEVEDLESGTRHAVRPGVVYALDRNDRHVLHAHTELRLVCVFSPALEGSETHDPSGSYPAPGGKAAAVTERST